MSLAAASPPLDDAVATQLAALLLDRDVSEVTAVEGMPLELVRRGRRERLDVRLDAAVFGMLKEEGASAGLVSYALQGGHRLVAAPLSDGRIAVRVHKAPNVDASLAVLVEEGALFEDTAQELLRGVHTGLGLVVIGPARSGRVRVLCAVARAVHERMFLVAITELAPKEALPVPLGGTVLDGRASVEMRALAAADLGADALVALELTAAELARLAAMNLPVPLLATAQSPSWGALQAALARGEKGTSIDAVCGQAAVVGFSPEGRPVVVELHGPADDAAAIDAQPAAARGPSSSRGASSGPSRSTPAYPPAASGSPETIARRAAARDVDAWPAIPSAGAGRGGDADEVLPPPPPYTAPPRARPQSSAPSASAGGLVSDEDAPVALGAPPPSSWASTSPDDDPGWELARVDPAAGGAAGAADATAHEGTGTPFDGALSRTRDRPAFSPRPPREHPQARALRGAGGLTFEPPSAPAGTAPLADLPEGPPEGAEGSADEDDAGPGGDVER